MISKNIGRQHLANTRDLGGMTGRDGKPVRPGLLFRSGALNLADESDKQWLRQTVGTVADLRNRFESDQRPDPVIEGIETVRLPILEEEAALATNTQDELLRGRSPIEIMTQEPLGLRYMCRIYAGFAENAYCRAQYGRFLRLLLEDHKGAVLWHCTQGKDRAGFAAILVQWILGVSEEDIREDYLATNRYLTGEIEEILEKFAGRLGALTDSQQKASRAFYSAREEYLESAFGKIRELYGSTDRYLIEGIGISEEEQEQLRKKYLEG